MSKVRAIVLLTLVIGVAFGSAAAKDTPFLQANATADQVALFAPFLSYGQAAGIQTALSVSNVLNAPTGVLPATGLSRNEGSIEIYFYTSDGDAVVVETEDNSIGNGVLDAQGELRPGRTWTALLSQILSEADALPAANEIVAGYAWIICNWDGAQGTVTVFFPDFGFAQSLNLEPTFGSGGALSLGVPVIVP
ncbi:MAG: hypothetical protein EHM61_05540 [Acidobacteria bacterium]|nr:MAG: hypothetical protein EHM61_05540 [Acidobacteriota bacterium]